MSDEQARLYDFGDSDGVLAYIKERSDDIEKAVIPQMRSIDLVGKDGVVANIEAGLILHLCDGHKQFVTPVDAEIVLNDGILNRMRIRIELFRGKT